MDQSLLSRRLRQTAAAEERIRLSRDLHDGVLQSLTGAALQLQTVQRLWDAEPADARERVAAIQRLIAEEQRNLRGFIRDSQLAPAGLTSGTEGLQAGLRELVQRLDAVWGLHVTLQIDRLTDHSSDALTYDLCLIVQEALVNAARHAGASDVRVDVASENDQTHIVVTDNGRGFPFYGQYDHAALISLGLGPVMLKERVKSVGGTLAILSTPNGARLDILVPSGPETG